MALKFDANITFLFREVSFLERFVAARECGFEAVEFLSSEGHDVQEIALAASKAGVKVVLTNLDMGDFVTGGLGLSGVPGRERAFRQAVGETRTLAAALEIPTVHVGPCRLAPGVSRGEALSVFSQNLSFAAEVFAEIGAILTVEPLNSNDTPNILIENIDQAKQAIERAGHPNLALQLDLYHAVQMERDYRDVLKSDLHRIAHIQFADYPGRNEPGTGQVNFEQAFDLIDALQYRGWVGAEYKPSRPTSETISWLKGNRAAEVAVS